MGEAVEPRNVTFNIIEADYESEDKQGMSALTGRDEESDDDSDDETYVDEPESESADELDSDDFVDEYEDENAGGARRSNRRNAGQPPVRFMDQEEYMHMNVGKDEEVEPIEPREGEQPIMGHIMAQYSLQVGLKKFGQRAKDSARKEMTQLHDMDTFFP